MTFKKGPSIRFVQSQHQLPYYSAESGAGDFDYVGIMTEGSVEIEITTANWMPLLGDFLIAHISIDGKDYGQAVLSSPGTTTTIVGNQVKDIEILFLDLSLPKDGVIADRMGEVVIKLSHGRFEGRGRGIVEENTVALAGTPLKDAWQPVGGARETIVFKFRYCKWEILVARGIRSDRRTGSSGQD